MRNQNLLRTIENIKSSFDSQENDLGKLDFASCNDNDNILIPDTQLKQILNIDETVESTNDEVTNNDDTSSGLAQTSAEEESNPFDFI